MLRFMIHPMLSLILMRLLVLALVLAGVRLIVVSLLK